jgi:uncharacterized protein (DUF983 family)
MNVTRAQIVRRGLHLRCMNCGEGMLFPPGSLRIYRRCPVCGTGFDRGEGFFLGPWVLNYTISVFCFVLPSIVLGARGVVPWSASFVLAAIGCVVLPALLYRAMWSAWLILYFFFLPHALPSNGGPTGVSEED